MLTASLHLDIAMTTLFRHASLFDGTLRFIAVFASFKDKSNCLAAWHPKQNETKLFFILKHMALFSFSKLNCGKQFREKSVIIMKPPFCFSTAGTQSHSLQIYLFLSVIIYFRLRKFENSMKIVENDMKTSQFKYNGGSPRKPQSASK